MTAGEYGKLNPYCEICGKPRDDTHHIKTKGSGGKDLEINYISLCRMHHMEVHSIGRWKFSDKYSLNWESKMIRKEWQ
jgi:hypothetical protein